MHKIWALTQKIGRGRLFLLLLLFPFLWLENYLKTAPMLVEKFFSEGISRALTACFSHILLVPAEWILLLAAAGAPVIFVLFLRGLYRTRQKGLYAAKKAALFFSFCAGLYMFYVLSWGINYYRMPLFFHLGLEEIPVTEENLRESCLWARDELNALAPLAKRNSEGLFDLSGQKKEVLKQAREGYFSLAPKFKILQKPLTKADGVSFFGLMNYTNITGFYFPFNGRPNVNTAAHPLLFPFTACHELGHQAGIAREDETNFAGFLSGIENAGLNFRYSAYAFAYLTLGNELYAANPEAYAEIARDLSPLAAADFLDYMAFLARYESPVGDFSEGVNDRYLHSRGEEEGVKSYDRVIRLLVAYHAAILNA